MCVCISSTVNTKKKYLLIIQLKIGGKKVKFELNLNQSRHLNQSK